MRAGPVQWPVAVMWVMVRSGHRAAEHQGSLPPSEQCSVENQTVLPEQSSSNEIDNRKTIRILENEHHFIADPSKEWNEQVTIVQAADNRQDVGAGTNKETSQ